MSKQKIYHQVQTKKGEYFVIFWDKGKYTMKQHQELTVNFNGIHHSYDIRDFNRYTINAIADAYIKNVTLGLKWAHDREFMNSFIQTLKPIVEEFKKDVEYRYSFDGWIGRIFIDPIENFVDWLKK